MDSEWCWICFLTSYSPLSSLLCPSTCLSSLLSLLLVKQGFPPRRSTVSILCSWMHLGCVFGVMASAVLQLYRLYFKIIHANWNCGTAGCMMHFAFCGFFIIWCFSEATLQESFQNKSLLEREKLQPSGCFCAAVKWTKCQLWNTALIRLCSGIKGHGLTHCLNELLWRFAVDACECFKHEI